VKPIRSALIAIGVLLWLVLGTSFVFHRIVCESFSLAACAVSPVPHLVEFWSSHRTVWLVFLVIYSLVVLLSFRAHFARSPSGRRVVGLLALALCAVAFALLLG
jgi:hypothetical protein